MGELHRVNALRWQDWSVRIFCWWSSWRASRLRCATPRLGFEIRIEVAHAIPNQSSNFDIRRTFTANALAFHRVDRVGMTLAAQIDAGLGGSKQLWFHFGTFD